MRLEACLAWEQVAEPPPLPPVLPFKVRLQSPSLAGQGCQPFLELNQNIHSL